MTDPFRVGWYSSFVAFCNELCPNCHRGQAETEHDRPVAGYSERSLVKLHRDRVCSVEGMYA